MKRPTTMYTVLLIIVLTLTYSGGALNASNILDIGDGEGISIVTVGDSKYLFLAPGLLYPFEDLGITEVVDDRVIHAIDLEEIKRIKLGFIATYRGEAEKWRTIEYIESVGGEVTYIYKYLPFIAFQIPLEKAVETVKAVGPSYLTPDIKLRLSLNESVDLIVDRDRLETISQRLGFEINGSGVVIAILDTGIDASHPDFYFPNGTSKIILSISTVPDEDPEDRYGHGTHVAGIAAGTGRASGGLYTGVAPGALLMNIKVISDEGFGMVSWIIAGIEAAVENGADVINLSLGGGLNGDGSDPLSMAVDWAVDQGVVVVAAAGNDGPDYYSLGSPAVANKAITVGATYKNGTLVDFSSRGPTGDLRVKPDVLAPGVDIIAPLARDSLFERALGDEKIPGDGGDYIAVSGTSMAAPHVAGVAALVKHARPDLSALEIRSLIISTADPVDDDLFSYGLGLVDAVDAINASLILYDPTLSIDARSDTLFDTTFIELNDASNLSIVNVSVVGFFGGVDGFTDLLQVDLSRVNATHMLLNVSLTGSPDPNLYVARILLRDSFGEFYSVGLTVYWLYELRLNATLNGDPYVVFFIAYNVDRPENWILPTGGVLNEDDTYYLWFRLPPGTYKVVGVSINSFMSEDLITGPVTVYGFEYALNRDITQTIEVNQYRTFDLPRKLGAVDLAAIGHLYTFYTPGNDPASIYQFGLWDVRKDYEMMFGYGLQEPFFLNIQYVTIPQNLSGWNYSEILDYTTTYLSQSWTLQSGARSLGISPVRYLLDTGFLVENESYLGGFAVFPPKQQFTFIVVGPVYQGAQYSILASDDIDMGFDTEFKYFLTVDGDGRISSLSVPDAEDNRKTFRPGEPPFFIFNRAVPGFTDEGIKLNLSIFLISSFEPFTIAGNYDIEYQVYVNNVLVREERDPGLPLISVRNVDVDPIYEIRYVMSSDKYPLMQRIEGRAVYDTSAFDYEPPMTIRMSVSEGEEGYTLSLSLADESELSVDILYRWGDGRYQEAEYTTKVESPLGFYQVTRYIADLGMGGGRLDIKVVARDTSGNIHEVEYIGIYDTELETPMLDNIILDIYPEVADPGIPVTIEARSSDDYVYGASLSIAGRHVLNIPVDREGFELVILPESIGVEEGSSFALLSKPSSMMDQPHKVDRRFWRSEIIVEFDVEKSIYSVGEEAAVNIRAVYSHNNSLVKGVEIRVNGVEYVAEDGVLTLTYTLDEPGRVSIEVESARVSNKYARVSRSVLPEPLELIFTQLVISYDGPEEFRVDVGSQVELTYMVYDALTNEPINGVLKLSADGVEIEVDIREGVASYIVSSYEVTDVDLEVLGALDTDRGIDVHISTAPPVKVIFDKVVVELSVERDHVPVGKDPGLTYNAYYAYDGEELDGEVVIETIGDPEKIGLVVYRVKEVVDRRYGLTVFEANEVTVTYDGVSIVVKWSDGLFTGRVMITATYEYSGDPVESMVVNGVEVEGGEYVDEFTILNPMVSKTYKVSVGDFVDEEYSVSWLSTSTLSIYLVLIVIAAAAAFLFIRRRGVKAVGS